MTLPLEGIRVLDFSRQLPGQYCTMTLADMGAEVLVIEEPMVTGRRAEQSQAALGGAAAAVPGVGRDEALIPYNTLNRNKKCIALNLKSEAARDIFYKLVKTADVVYETYRPGVVKRLGVDYDTVKQINPRIVYCSLTGYGQDGPYRNLVGHDTNYIAVAGILGLSGERGGDPVMPGVQIADVGGGGLQSIVGILLALMARERTGWGQYVDISMTDGCVTWLAGLAARYFATGVAPQRGARITPFGNAYKTKDGKYISIHSLEPWFWENLCRALGCEEFLPDQNAEGEKREEIIRRFKEVFLTKTREEWFQLLSKTDICVGPVYDFDEVFSDPQVLHRKMLVELDHPTLGKVKQIGISVKLSDTPGTIRSFAPSRGQHTDEVLLDLGYAKAEIEELRTQGAIK